MLIRLGRLDIFWMSDFFLDSNGAIRLAGGQLRGQAEAAKNNQVGRQVVRGDQAGRQVIRSQQSWIARGMSQCCLGPITVKMGPKLQLEHSLRGPGLERVKTRLRDPSPCMNFMHQASSLGIGKVRIDV